MTVELIVFSGLQASGKTTFYRERFSATHVRISKDAWPNARKKEDRQRRLIDEHLRAGKPVIVDNTNPTPLERESLIAIARPRIVQITCASRVSSLGMHSPVRAHTPTLHSESSVHASSGPPISGARSAHAASAMTRCHGFMQ